MIDYAKKRYSKNEMIDLMTPLIRTWFDEKFETLTEPQSYAIPLIHEQKNTLISSPTGSGKTITAFLSIINELYALQLRGELERKIYCVYVSPLKALANDIEKNLNSPLREMRALAEEIGMPAPEIEVGVRSGDTTQSERARMARRPPHIFITTPESLAIILSTTKFSEKFVDVQYFIIDEIHEISSSKRGVFLSLTAERLQEHISGDMTRIGLSATQAPIEEIGRFLVGYHRKGTAQSTISEDESTDKPSETSVSTYDHPGELRDLTIVEVRKKKELDIQVLCPVEDLTSLPYEVVNDRMYDTLLDLIEQHQTTLVFTNTRSATEAIVYKLKEKGLPPESIAAHHGSLSKEVRLEVEHQLKQGELRVVVSSTSLELGIDIGSVDLVCQIGSPKTVAKFLQRIGRSGHQVTAIPKGRLIVSDSDDMVECAVLARYAKAGNIDRVFILKNSLDVLAQTLVGMSLEDKWVIDDAYDLVCSSFCYHDLPRSQFDSVMAYLGGSAGLEREKIYPKMWVDGEQQQFGIRRGTRMIYNMNLGTIPQESSYSVLSEKRKFPLGSLSEKFVEKLVRGDVFVLGGKTYQFLESRNMEVVVRDAHGKKPTVPSWTGEMLPRSFDLSRGIGEFRERIGSLLVDLKNAATPPSEPTGETGGPEEGTGVSTGEKQSMEYERIHTALRDLLMNEYCCDANTTRSIISYLREQLEVCADVPTDKRLLVEGFIDGKGLRNLIFHFSLGRRVNDALSRAYANALTIKLRSNVRISLTDNNFMLTFSKRIPANQVPTLITPGNFEENLRSAVQETELFKQRFRHVANRSFAILKAYKGRKISLHRQHRSTERMLGSFSQVRDFPVIEETYNEILHDAMDLDNAALILAGIADGEIELVVRDYSEMPTPFAHGVILAGMSDIVMMEDRSALLRELHRRILDTVVEGEGRQYKYKTNIVEAYFEERRPVIDTKGDIPGVLKEVGAVHIFDEKRHKLSDYAPDVEKTKLYDWCIELINAGTIISIGANRWVAEEDLPSYAALFSRQPPKKLRDIHARIQSETAVNPAKRGSKGTTKPSGDPAMSLLSDLKADELRSLERTLAVHVRFRPLEKNKKTRPSFTRLEDILKERKLRQEHFIRVPDTADFEESIDRVVTQCLSYYAPCTVEEIAYRTGISEKILDQALRELEDRAIIAAGYYVAEKTLLQYMMARDVIYLDAVHRGGHEVFEYEKAQWLNYEKYFNRKDIDAYFDTFGFVSSPRILFNGVKHFDAERWQALRDAGEIVEGRFMRGRVGYVRREDAPLYTAAYRDEYLTTVDRAVLAFLEHNGEAYRSLIARNVEATEEMLADSIDRLDRNLYLYRKHKSGYDHYSINFYALTDTILPEELPYTREQAQRTIIERFVKGHSPVSLNAVRRETGFEYDLVTATLADLEARDLVRKILVTGEAQSITYLWHEDMESLKQLGVGQLDATGPRISAPWSPFLRRQRRRMRGMFGDMISGIVIIDREPAGAILHFRMSGCVEVRELELTDPAHLPEAVRALDGLLDYYRTTGVDILRITRVGSVPVKDLDRKTLAIFKKAGFKRVQSWLLKGNIVHRTYDRNEVLSYVLWKQRVFREHRFDSVLSAIDHRGGFRTDLELAQRVQPDVFMPLKECHRHHGVVVGKLMFGYMLYCTLERAGIWYRAMDHELVDVERKILFHMPEGRKGIAMRELMGKCGIVYSVFQKAFKNLYEKGATVRLPYGKYAAVPDPGITVDEARKRILHELIRDFGIVSVEQILSLTRSMIRTGQVRKLLRELESDGTIVKGYFIRGDIALYYMEKGAEKQVLRHTHREGFVLTPMDRLFYYLSDQVREQFGMGSCYAIIDHAEIIAVFRCRKKGNELSIHEYFGDAEGMPIAEDWARHTDVTLDWKIEEINGTPLEEVLGER